MGLCKPHNLISLSLGIRLSSNKIGLSKDKPIGAFGPREVVKDDFGRGSYEKQSSYKNIILPLLGREPGC
jgi:hypothetical protein